jgi:2-oxoglutarate ferredoxin oxidoreductase subunit gamma
MPGRAQPKAVTSRWEIVMAGEGGQGLVVAGIILGEAAVIEGLEAVQSQWVLGSATRGSLSRSEVVISQGEIAFPRVLGAGILLALTQDALKRHLGMAAPDALVIVDRDGVPDVSGVGPGRRVARLPILAAAGSLGLGRSANVFALGVVQALSGVVRRESIEEALRRRFGAKVEPNLRAFRCGVELALERKPPRGAGEMPLGSGHHR